MNAATLGLNADAPIQAPRIASNSFSGADYR
jgi:hypothetical protein